MKKFNTATKNIFLGFMALLVFVAVGAGVIKVVEGFSKAQAATSCVITLFGKQYDVTALQNAHTGGNLFACGTDMTATYQAQHGTDVSRMLPYLIPDPTPTPTVTPAPTDTPTPTVTPAPTDTPLPTVTPPVTSTSSYHEDEGEIEEEEHETVNDNRENDHVSAEIKENDDDHNDDNDNGHHLVGANSAHGTMDNTFKKEQEEE